MSKFWVYKRLIYLIILIIGMGLLLWKLLPLPTTLPDLAPPQTAIPSSTSAQQIVFLKSVDEPDLWRLPIDLSLPPIQITFTGGKVYDYAVAPDGSHLTYSAHNEQQGVDLWEVGMDGKNLRILLACVEDVCTEPAYSPDGRTLAYSHRPKGGLFTLDTTASSIWLLHLADLSSQSLLPKPTDTGIQPVWSPDGQWMAYADERDQTVQVFNLSTKEMLSIESDQGNSVAWSLDSRSFYFTRTHVRSDEQVYVFLYLYDMTTRKEHTIFGEDTPDIGSYNLPAIAPDSHGFAFTASVGGSSVGQQIFTAYLTGQSIHPVTTADRYAHGALAWDSTGARLLFQRIELGNSDARPEVFVWDAKSGVTTLVAQDAALPTWIPKVK